MTFSAASWGMLATPFTDDLTLDAASMRSCATTLVDRGCSGLIALGVIAEPNSLTLAEKLGSIECALAGGVPVIAGVMAIDAAQRRREAQAFGTRYGSDLSALMLPVLSSDARELIRQVHEVQESSGLTVALQDYPASSGVTIDTDALLEVARATGVTIIKSEAQPTFHRIRQLKEAAPHLTLMSGLGGSGLIEDLASGATAAAIGITRPEIITETMRLWSREDLDAARDLISSVGPLIHFEIQQGTSIGIRKEHWRRQGVMASAAVRPPAIPYQQAFAPLSRGLGY
ncbi:dihydrodipicolinate synthase family protein [Mycobacterium sp. 21AC1]|uniref:dihydrodipicolinate synthase family protein n=1 Tax=[Mycobacterium] appelbergii TaxID=2939269 RepID=UPI002939311C|nr:dihydrodipicolinate synthase family protein [Mycobacterium sp. 21AC1]MDV3124130.1 dihydrodipicolinate synthase family protein [Mycobacterium sp. 21AC1]